MGKEFIPEKCPRCGKDLDWIYTNVNATRNLYFDTKYIPGEVDIEVHEDEDSEDRKSIYFCGYCNAILNGAMLSLMEAVKDFGGHLNGEVYNEETGGWE
jgi:hypothetical protein